MYGSGTGVALGGAAVGALAATGLNVVYVLCAAFALLAAGLAVLRVAPSMHRAEPVARRQRRTLARR